MLKLCDYAIFVAVLCVIFKHDFGNRRIARDKNDSLAFARKLLQRIRPSAFCARRIILLNEHCFVFKISTTDSPHHTVLAILDKSGHRIAFSTNNKHRLVKSPVAFDLDPAVLCDGLTRCQLPALRHRRIERQIRFEPICFRHVTFDFNFRIHLSGSVPKILGLFCQFDKPFDIIIDKYEEEELPADKIQTAIEMAETYASKSPIEIKASTEKLLVALKRAKELGKPLELFF